MTLQDRIKSLPLWRGAVDISPLEGGITNRNFLVLDGVHKAVVRVGHDIPVHQIMRFNELAASTAAHAAGVSPAVIYHQDDMLVIDYIEGRTLAAADFADDAILDQAIALVARAHRDIPAHLRGPALMFWVFHVIRDYARTLSASNSRMSARLPEFLELASELERVQLPQGIVFAHNDLIPANFIEADGRLWLIDFEYAAFSTPAFDLANVASMASLAPAEDEMLLAAYHGREPDAALRRSHAAMRVAALLRESLWSMVSELHLNAPGANYVRYTAETLARFEAELEAYRARFGTG